MARVWYIDSNRTAINWATAVTGGIARIDIFRLEDVPGTNNDLLTKWRETGQTVSASAVAAAQAESSTDPVPAARVPNVVREERLDGTLRHHGSRAGFYGAAPVVKPAALTATDTRTFTAADTALVDATYGAEEVGVINNLRTRLGESEAVVRNLRTRLAELEGRLRSLGLLT